MKIEKALTFLELAGYGKGSNFTTTIVAELMISYAHSTANPVEPLVMEKIAVVDLEYYKACSKIIEQILRQIPISNNKSNL